MKLALTLAVLTIMASTAAEALSPREIAARKALASRCSPCGSVVTKPTTQPTTPPGSNPTYGIDKSESDAISAAAKAAEAPATDAPQ